MSDYNVAQICFNGHVATARLTEYPERNQAFCGKCGKKAITNCSSCRTPIRGLPLKTGLLAITYRLPAYCIQCGAAYPWTELALTATRELVDEFDSLSAEEREQLREWIRGTDERDLEFVELCRPVIYPVAMQIRQTLEQNGVTLVMQGAHSLSVQPHLVFGGQLRVLVPKSQLEFARELYKAYFGKRE